MLRGAAVVISERSERSGPSHDAMGTILDMSGPAAELSPAGAE